MLVAVTGGTGFIGRHLVRTLVENGQQVRVLTRRPALVRQLWRTGDIEPWLGDLTEPKSLRGFARGVSVVYHLAGENRDPRQMDRVNVAGTENLLEACRDHDLEKLVHLSSISAMGPSSALRVDENTPCNPEGAYQQAKYAAELIALRSVKKFQLPVTVIRPTSVFGEEPTHDDDRWAVWFKSLLKGRFRFFGAGDSVANYVYVGDVVGACLLVASSEKATGEIHIVSDSCPLRDFVGAATGFLGVETPGTLPVWLGYAAAIAFEMAGKLARFSPPLTVSRVRALTNRSMYSSNKLREELGFKPAVGWREGLRRTIEWYKRKGLLSFAGF